MLAWPDGVVMGVYGIETSFSTRQSIRTLQRVNHVDNATDLRCTSLWNAPKSLTWIGHASPHRLKARESSGFLSSSSFPTHLFVPGVRLHVSTLREKTLGRITVDLNVASRIDLVGSLTGCPLVSLQSDSTLQVGLRAVSVTKSCVNQRRHPLASAYHGQTLAFNLGV